LPLSSRGGGFLRLGKVEQESWDDVPETFYMKNNPAKEPSDEADMNKFGQKDPDKMTFAVAVYFKISRLLDIRRKKQTGTL